MKPIYTLDYLRKEAQGIQAAWNGEDEIFTYNGELYSEDNYDEAVELEDLLNQVEMLITDLSL